MALSIGRRIKLRYYRFVAAAAALLLFVGCAAPPQRDDAAVRVGVAALVKDWSSAGAEGRWEDLKALYADEPGFAWIEQGRLAYADHAAVVAGVDAAKDVGATIRSSVSDIAVTPLAADAAAFQARTVLAVESPSFSFAFDGRISGVAVKRGDKWLFLQGHLSSPPTRTNPPAAKAN